MMMNVMVVLIMIMRNMVMMSDDAENNGNK